MSRFKTIKIRRDTASSWMAVNPVLSNGEGGLETDTDKLKYGDGVTPWNSLPYLTQGLKGDKGDKGDTGSQGVPGNDGTDGAKGDKGDTGLPGSQGIQGPTGATGATGAKGDRGDRGLKGDTGSPGPQGIQGDKGDKGLKGDTGLTGATGATGAKGDKGDTGAKGDTGSQGIQGIQGVQGDPGVIQTINGYSQAVVTLTTADIADSTDKRYVTDADLTTISNQSGTNTGDNATNSQYSGLDAAKVNKAGDTMSGNLNMGTNKLIGGTGITDILKLQGTTGNGTAASAAIQLLTGNNGATTALTVLNSGNVGIGTTSPGAKFDVTGGHIMIGTNTSKIVWGTGDGTTYIYGDATGATGSIRLGTANVDRLTVLYGGNVGIGTTSPGAKLQVDTGAAGTIGQIIKGAAAQTADLLQIQNSSGTIIDKITSDGSIGIGTGTVFNRMQVTGGNLGVYNVGAGGQIYLGNDNFLNSGYYNSAPGIGAVYSTATTVYGDLGLYVYNSVANSRTEVMRLLNNGNVGIGTTAPSEKLDVSGTIKATGYKSSDGSAGVSGSFTTTDGKTITIKDGLVVSIL